MARVETVRGPISPDELGVTLPHEHLLAELTVWWVEPTECSKLNLVDAPITLDILHMLRRDASFSRENLKLGDPNVAIDELMLYKKAGGCSLVDVTLPGIGRNPLALREISNATGVNVFTGTGWYIAASHPAIVKEKSLEELSDIMVKELTEGIGDTGIKAGLIGECGLSYPIDPDEEKVIRAAARAQAKTGCAYTIHPPIYDLERKKIVKNATDILDIIQEEGANLEKFYMSHMDTTCDDLEYHKKVMDTYEIVLAYDSFGSEYYDDSLYPGANDGSDKTRTNAIVELCNAGYEKQLIMSQDVAIKIQRVKYGGYGYAHVLKHIVPVLRFQGVTEKQIRTMTVDNPKRLLAY